MNASWCITYSVASEPHEYMALSGISQVNAHVNPLKASNFIHCMHATDDCVDYRCSWGAFKPFRSKDQSRVMIFFLWIIQGTDDKASVIINNKG